MNAGQKIQEKSRSPINLLGFRESLLPLNHNMATQPFTAAHRSLIKKLYRTALRDSLDWNIDRSLWRNKAVEIRVQFERNRDVRDPRALSALLEETAERVKSRSHPDPYIPPLAPGGTKWERNIPPPMFSAQEKEAALQVLRAQGLARY